MQCAHCLRGEMENADLPAGTINLLLPYVENIDSLTLTGGEPSIALEQVDDVINSIKAAKTPIYSFYCVTNGKAEMLPFAQRMLELNSYCIQCGGETDCCGVALSKDRYHEDIPKEHEMILRGLAAFRKDKFQTGKKNYLLKMGRAAGLADASIEFIPDCSNREKEIQGLSPDDIDVFENSNGDTVFAIDKAMALTVNGDILSRADYEYDDIEDIIIGNVKDMSAVINQIKWIVSEEGSKPWKATPVILP